MAELPGLRLEFPRWSPDGNVIADYTGEVGDPAALAARLAAAPGVIEHGLFPPSMVNEVIIGRGEAAERLELRPQ